MKSRKKKKHKSLSKIDETLYRRKSGPEKDKKKDKDKKKCRESVKNDDMD